MKAFRLASPSRAHTTLLKVSALPCMDAFIGEVGRTCSWFCPMAVDPSFLPNGLIFNRPSIPQSPIGQLA